MTAPSLVYFGDSLSDDGNLYAYGDGILPDDIRDAISGPTHAVSDGQTHAAHTGALLGIDEVNYAVAAAEAWGSQTLAELVIESGYEDDLLVPITDPALQLDINLGAQVDRFTADSTGAELSQTAAFLLIGGNDFSNLDFSSPTLLQDAALLIHAVVGAIADATEALLDAGTRTVWIAEMPAPAFFASSAEYSPVELAAADAAFAIFNELLNQQEDMLRDQGHDVRIAHTTLVADAIVDDPTGFGLLAPYADTILHSDATDSFDNDQIAFYDSIHPSTATHGILGAFNALQLSGGATITGDAGDDALTISAPAAAGTVAFGLAGDDRIETASAARLIAFGGTGADTLNAAGGDDLLSGGAGDDVLNGRRGDDVLNGGGGNDTVRGMIGDDVLIDGLGCDMLRGGLGDDIFIFAEAALLGGLENGLNIFVGGAGHDTLYLVLETAAAVTDALLDNLGIRTAAIEEIVVLEDRAALAGLSDEDWYPDADAWGLV